MLLCSQAWKNICLAKLEWFWVKPPCQLATSQYKLLCQERVCGLWRQILSAPSWLLSEEISGRKIILCPKMTGLDESARLVICCKSDVINEQMGMSWTGVEEWGWKHNVRCGAPCMWSQACGGIIYQGVWFKYIGYTVHSCAGLGPVTPARFLTLAWEGHDYVVCLGTAMVYGTAPSGAGSGISFTGTDFGISFTGTDSKMSMLVHH